MLCIFCKQFGVFWKNLGTIAPYTYCPNCSKTNCHQVEEEDFVDENQEDI
jgi:hypothetical protein